MPIKSVHPRDIDAIEREEQRDTLSLWLPVVAHGIVITALGIVAVAVPTVSTSAAEIVIGLAFLTAGIVGIMAVLATGWLSPASRCSRRLSAGSRPSPARCSRKRSTSV